jgi:hypothetical protein
MTVSASDNTGRNICPEWLRITSMRIKYAPAACDNPHRAAGFKKICEDTGKVLELLKAGKTKRQAAKALGLNVRRVHYINARAEALGII